MTLLLDYARDTVGLRMGGLIHGQHIGHTTDAAKAELMRETGARVVRSNGAVDGLSNESMSAPAATCPAWEISFAVGRELP